MDVVIRSEHGADVGLIRAVTEAAFAASPYGYNNEAGIIDALREAGALFISLVAEHCGNIIGHVAVSPVEVTDGASGWYGLGPISVLSRVPAKRSWLNAHA